jgi:hypothetical protein
VDELLATKQPVFSVFGVAWLNDYKKSKRRDMLQAASSGIPKVIRKV